MSLTPIFVVTLVSEPILPPVAGPTFARCFAIRTIFVIPLSQIIVYRRYCWIKPIRFRFCPDDPFFIGSAIGFCRSYHRPNFCSDLKIIRLIDQRIGSVYLLIVALPAFFLAASLFLPLAFRFFAFFSYHFDYTVFGIVLQEILCHDKKPGLPKENRAETYSIMISLVE